MVVRHLWDGDLMLSWVNKKDEIKWSRFQGGDILIDINPDIEQQPANKKNKKKPHQLCGCSDRCHLLIYLHNLNMKSASR